MFMSSICYGSAYFTDDSGPWIISGLRLVQTQDASSEDVYVVPRTRGSEVAVPSPPPPTFPQGNGINALSE